jgi:predicted O-methyltransferase YrrM
MNSQSARLELTRQLITQCKIARIVETGTFFGVTTEFFAQYGVPVTTVENNLNYARHAQERLAGWSNVDLRVEDSVRVLTKLGSDPIDHTVPTLFYLDAHWRSHLPLREEATLALKHFAKALLLVDDFSVPDDPGYGFDDYGPDMRLTLDYLLQGDLSSLTVYFPSTPSHLETGARRGCVVTTFNPELVAILDQIKMLRRWEV